MSGHRTEGFRARLLSGELLVGTFVKTPSPIVCEVLGGSSLDAVCLDAEHAPFGRMELDGCLAVARLADLPTLVRVPAPDPSHLLNALDGGATGVLVPHVASAEAARSVAAHCRFGPQGRGYSGSTRAARFGHKPMVDHVQDSAAQTVVIAQVEDVEALDAIEEIAAVEGIDCLFVGRMDLTVALGAAGPDAPSVIEAVDNICSVCQRIGRRVGMFVADPAEAVEWQAKGASLFLMSSDHNFLKTGADGLARSFRTV